MAERWKIRPSEYMGLLEESMERDGGFTAYCFDEACTHFGETITIAMEQAKGKTDAQKRGNAENILRKYLGLPQKFRDIGQLGKGKQQPPEARPDPPFRME
jgi:hypothetical protein